MCGGARPAVVDAEDKQNHVFKKLMPFDGGISGWKLLWDRLNPFSSGRTADLPRYHQMVDTLMYAPQSARLV